MKKLVFYSKLKVKYQFIILTILILFTFIDGVLQYFLGIESNNFRRIFTGFLAGVGFGFFVETVMNLAMSKKKKITR